jgi:hypothetical protein
MLMMLNAWMQTKMNKVNRGTQVRNEIHLEKMLEDHAKQF